jgi:hypothetical protein
MKKALRPAWRPSPCSEWKVSTIGRDNEAKADSSRGLAWDDSISLPADTQWRLDPP